MGKWSKFRKRVLSGAADRNISFDELCGFLEHLGFNSRTRGSHRIFRKDDIPEILNLQPTPNASAKPYQVKQVRALLLEHSLGDDDAEV